MSLSRLRHAMIIALTVPLGVATATAQQYGQEGQAQPKVALATLLIPAVNSALATVISNVISGGVGCALGRFVSWITGSNDSGFCKPDVQSTAAPGVSSSFQQAPGFSGASYTPEQVNALVAQPIIPLFVSRLANAQPGAAVIEQFRTDSGKSDTFTMYSGDAFAITFASTVPGRARIVNMDATGKVDSSDVYEVVPGEDNRMPRAYQGAIQLDDNVGMETLRIDFKPCISPALQTHPAVAQFTGKLPICNEAIATRQFVVGNAASSAYGKGMNIPSSGDPNMVVGITPREGYAKGEGLSMTININHQPRQSSQVTHPASTGSGAVSGQL